MNDGSSTSLLDPGAHAPGAVDEARTVVVARDVPEPGDVRVVTNTPRRRGGAAARTILLTLACAVFVFVVYVLVGTPLQHRAAQTSRFASLRGQLARGVAPISPVDAQGKLLPLGTPIALIRIPSTGMHEVVGEGTTGEVLESGPGHLRTTVFPGGAGTSVVFGRAAAYGGPFRSIDGLDKGTRIEVTTGAGTAVFRVVGVRRAGDKIPPLESGAARLTLVTAGGLPFVPSGVVAVDADLEGKALGVAAPPGRAVSGEEQPLGTDTSAMFALVLWLEALLVVIALATWMWHRRGPATTWLIFFAPAAFVATQVAAQLTRLLPNLL